MSEATTTAASAPAKRSQGRTWAIRLATTLLGLLVGLGLAELSLWILDLPRVHHGHQNFIHGAAHLLPDGMTRFYNRGGVEEKFIYEDNPRGYFGPENEVSHVTNVSGFRGDEFMVKKSPGAFRAIFLGDSFTFGEGVKFADTYPEVVRAELQKILAEQGRTVDCFNLGVSGSNTSDEKWCLDTVGWRLDPDLVVLGYVLNDTQPSAKWTLSEETPPRYHYSRSDENVVGPLYERIMAEPPDRWIYRLRTARLAWKYWNARAGSNEFIRLTREMYDDRYAGWQENRDALQGIVAECRERGVPCIVVIFPLLHQLQNYPFTDLHAKIRDVIGDQAFVIDLLPEFKDRNADDLLVHVTDLHPNEIADRIAAKKIVEAITTQGFAAPRVTEPVNKPISEMPK